MPPFAEAIDAGFHYAFDAAMPRRELSLRH